MKPMPNPFKRPWAATPAGQIQNAEGVTVALLPYSTDAATRGLLVNSPLTFELLRALSTQLDQAHRDEAELLQALEKLEASFSALMADPMPDDGHGRTLRHGAALAQARALIFKRRGVEGTPQEAA